MNDKIKMMSSPENATDSYASTCIWQYNDDECMWEASCGELWIINDGTPADNKMDFCLFCGKRLKEE